MTGFPVDGGGNLLDRHRAASESLSDLGELLLAACREREIEEILDAHSEDLDE
jgi:hypothetical protein